MRCIESSSATDNGLAATITGAIAPAVPASVVAVFGVVISILARPYFAVW